MIALIVEFALSVPRVNNLCAVDDPGIFFFSLLFVYCIQIMALLATLASALEAKTTFKELRKSVARRISQFVARASSIATTLPVRKLSTSYSFKTGSRSRSRESSTPYSSWNASRSPTRQAPSAYASWNGSSSSLQQKSLEEFASQAMVDAAQATSKQARDIPTQSLKRDYTRQLFSVRTVLDFEGILDLTGEEEKQEVKSNNQQENMDPDNEKLQKQKRYGNALAVKISSSQVGSKLASLVVIFARTLPLHSMTHSDGLWRATLILVIDTFACAIEILVARRFGLDLKPYTHTIHSKRTLVLVLLCTTTVLVSELLMLMSASSFAQWS
jgi:hypothetical protein